MAASIRRLDPKKTVLLVCDIQAKFSGSLFHGQPGVSSNNEATGDAIYGFQDVVATTRKMFKIAKVGPSTATVTGSINDPFVLIDTRHPRHRI